MKFSPDTCIYMEGEGGKDEEGKRTGEGEEFTVAVLLVDNMNNE